MRIIKVKDLRPGMKIIDNSSYRQTTHLVRTVDFPENTRLNRDVFIEVSGKSGGGDKPKATRWRFHALDEVQVG